MSDFASIRLVILRALAHLQAAIDSGDEALELRLAAERVFRRAQRLMRRGQLTIAEREELLDLLASTRRSLGVLPRPHAA